MDGDTVDSVSKEHVEIVEGNCHNYRIRMGGTLDGFNTVYYLDTYLGFKREEVKFEPNECLTIENIGDVDVVNPRIVINGRRNWYSIDDILGEIITEDMTDMERALAIYSFISDISVQAHENDLRVGPAYPDDSTNPSANLFSERADPVKAVNFYYCSGCSLSAANFVILCRHAGLEARAVWIDKSYNHHCVAEVKYNGEYHLFDPEIRVFYLDEDNTNIASYEKVHRNPDLERRTHNHGFASAEERFGLEAERYAGNFPPYSMPVDDWASRMDVTLRPGESLIRRWDNIGKFGRAFNVRNKGFPPHRLANGKIIYRPDLSREAYRRGTICERNIISSIDDGGFPKLRPYTVGKPALIMYKVASPYPIVGGKIGGRFFRASEGDRIDIYCSRGRDLWVRVWSAEETGSFEECIPIDGYIDPLNTEPVYVYYVKYEFYTDGGGEDVGIDEVYLESDLQMAATSLPALSVGVNEVVYTDETKGPHRVKVSHGWRESSDSTPPKVSSKPLFPEDGGIVPLDSLDKLMWEEALDPDGLGIAHYRIQVSSRPDFLIPVSPNFDRLTSDGKPEWDVPRGWLVEGRRYYWRVKAVNRWGAWSNWSPSWSFKVEG